MVLVADECRIEKESGIMRVWYPKGKQPTIRVDQEREAVSFYGALDVSTGRETVMRTDWQSSGQTVKFLRRLEDKYVGRRVLLIWDGAPSHRGEVREYLKERNKKWQLEIMYFPPYSPDLNPQEGIWKIGKEKHVHNSEEDFQTKVVRFHRCITHRIFRTSLLEKYS